MPYSESAAWIVEQMASGGGQLSDFDGHCVAVLDARVVAVGPTPKDVHAQLNLRDVPRVTFFRVNLMDMV